MVKVVILLTAALLAISAQASELSIPSFAFIGDKAALKCNVNVGDFAVKSITWSKDGKQFYQHTGKTDPATVSEVDGVVVDKELSSAGTVTIQSLTAESAGLYSCKVEIDHPTFDVAELSGTLKTIVLTRSMKLPPGFPQ